MIQLKGKYNEATIFSDKPEYKCFDQIKEMLDCEPFKNFKIRIMPDYHAGAGCVIGFTASNPTNIVPNIIGVDIGCGVRAINIGRNLTFGLKELDDIIRTHVPSGFDVNDCIIKPVTINKLIDGLRCREHLKNVERLRHSLGTLGGGNHFIELNYSGWSGYWLVIHTGSRNLGKQVAEYYQDVARKDVGGVKDKLKRALPYLPPEEREGYIKQAKESMKVPKGLEFLGNDVRGDYLRDMRLCQEFASYNRELIGEEIMNRLNLSPLEVIESVHNYYDFGESIIRKGAIAAYKDTKCIIPMNMRDGSLICVGKGNPEWNYSAPHGAGRILSRSAAKSSFTLEEYQEQMKGVFSTSVDIHTIDECPMAYKPMEEIVSQIGDTVRIIDIIKPVYNFKASS